MMDNGVDTIKSNAIGGIISYQGQGTMTQEFHLPLGQAVVTLSP